MSRQSWEYEKIWCGIYDSAASIISRQNRSRYVQGSYYVILQNVIRRDLAHSMKRYSSFLREALFGMYSSASPQAFYDGKTKLPRVKKFETDVMFSSHWTTLTYLLLISPTRASSII